jgi:hypothetical protein
MAARRRKGATRFVTGERAEVYRYVRRGVIGASGDSSRSGRVIARTGAPEAAIAPEVSAVPETERYVSG